MSFWRPASIEAARNACRDLVLFNTDSVEVLDNSPELSVPEMNLHVVDYARLDYHLLVPPRVGDVVMRRIERVRGWECGIKREIAVETTDNPLGSQALLH